MVCFIFLKVCEVTVYIFIFFISVNLFKFIKILFSWWLISEYYKSIFLRVNRYNHFFVKSMAKYFSYVHHKMSVKSPFLLCISFLSKLVLLCNWLKFLSMQDVSQFYCMLLWLLFWRVNKIILILKVFLCWYNQITYILSALWHLNNICHIFIHVKTILNKCTYKIHY